MEAEQTAEVNAIVFNVAVTMQHIFRRAASTYVYESSYYYIYIIHTFLVFIYLFFLRQRSGADPKRSGAIAPNAQV